MVCAVRLLAAAAVPIEAELGWNLEGPSGRPCSSSQTQPTAQDRNNFTSRTV